MVEHFLKEGNVSCMCVIFQDCEDVLTNANHLKASFIVTLSHHSLFWSIGSESIVTFFFLYSPGALTIQWTGNFFLILLQDTVTREEYCHSYRNGHHFGNLRPQIKREITLPQALYALLALVIQECWVIGPFYWRERFI